ncbi:MAG: hypothetical protein AB8U25_00440 [Rickettsiales endosymbiont of Dermacentor nuttalli]
MRLIKNSLASRELVRCNTNGNMKRLYNCKQLYFKDIEIFYSLDELDKNIEE